MRFFFSVYLLGLLTLCADPNWASSYNSAFEKAQEEEKGVMVLLSQERCDACWYMENIVLGDDELVRRVESRFIPLYLDIHHDDLHGLKFTGTPTLYFLTNREEPIQRLEGVYNIKELTAVLRKIEVSKKSVNSQ